MDNNTKEVLEVLLGIILASAILYFFYKLAELIES
jgi:hypothetical protein